MTMVRLAANLVLLAWVLSAQPPAPPPDAAGVDVTLQRLKEARKDASAEDRAEVIAAAGRVDDARVSDAVAAFLRDPEPAVRLAAVRALRYVKNAKALDHLVQAAGEKEVRKDDALLAEVLYALGQHGDKKGLPALIEDVWSEMEGKVVQARLAAIAHVRDKASVEALLKLLDQGVGRGGRRKDHAKPVFRALHLLTGQEIEDDIQAWKSWWRDKGDAFKVPAEPTWLRPPDLKAWQRLWTPPGERPPRKKNSPSVP